MSFDVQFPGLGLEFTINRVALSIGGFNIYWYGVIIAAGMVLAMLFAFRNADDFGINSDRLIDVILVGAVMAIVCARIYYIVFAQQNEVLADDRPRHPALPVPCLRGCH